jgi:hypothetical protein
MHVAGSEQSAGQQVVPAGQLFGLSPQGVAPLPDEPDEDEDEHACASAPTQSAITKNLSARTRRS